MKKILITIGLVVAVFIAGFTTLNSYIYNEKQGNDGNTVTPYRATLSGEYVCLPHADQSGPQTLECAFGIKTDSGEYYVVDFNLASGEIPDINVGERFSASGIITPIENLSSDQWKKYAIEGILSVTGSVKKE